MDFFFFFLTEGTKLSVKGRETNGIGRCGKRWEVWEGVKRAMW